MAEQKPVIKPTQPKPNVSVTQKPAPKPLKIEPESEQKPKEDNRGGDTVKLGRNSDGTFAEGNQISKGNNGGRPSSAFSHRAMAKARAEANPDRIIKDLEELDKIIESDATSPMEKMKALDIKIRLFEGYDPSETKDVTPEKIKESPLNGLTIEELRKLKALKEQK